MKVLILGDLADFPWRMAKCLASKYDVELWVREDEPYVHGEPWFKVWKGGRFSRFNNLRKAMNAADIIHATGEYAFYPYLFRKKFIAHAMGTDIRYIFKQKGWKGKLLRKAFDAAEKIVFHQPDQIRQLRGHFRPSIHFIHHPLDLAFWNAQQPTEHEGLRVLAPNNIDYIEKGSNLISDVIKRLKSNINFKIVERGPDALDMKDAHKEWNWVQPVKNQEAMRGWYEWTDVVVGGGLFFGSLCGVDFEVLACQRPVVENLDEGPYAMYYDVLPPVVSSFHVEKLLDRGYRVMVGEEGRKWMRQYHDGRLFMEEIRAVYEMEK